MRFTAFTASYERRRVSTGKLAHAALRDTHPLKGRDKGRWSIWVNGNWRLSFEFRNGDPYVLDYEDYH